MAPPTGYANPFAIFGRQRPAPPPPPPEEEDVFDDDFNPNAQGVEPVEYDDEMGADEQYTFDDGAEDSEGAEGEVMEDHIEDGDEEMLDRGA